MRTPLLPDLVHVDAIPRSETPPPPIVLFEAYGELMLAHPEYKPRYDELLNRLAQTQPHNSLILSALGRRAVLRGTSEGFAEGEHDIGQAIAEGSTLSSDFELYANLLIRLGKVSQAIDILKQGIHFNPYSTRLYKRLALAYIQIQDYPHALQTMKRELQVFPEDSLMRRLVAKVESSSSAPSR
jgi:tetratricopeptide (TPR) repeat protein